MIYGKLIVTDVIWSLKIVKIVLGKKEKKKKAGLD